MLHSGCYPTGRQETCVVRWFLTFMQFSLQKGCPTCRREGKGRCQEEPLEPSKMAVFGRGWLQHKPWGQHVTVHGPIEIMLCSFVVVNNSPCSVYLGILFRFPTKQETVVWQSNLTKRFWACGHNQTHIPSRDWHFKTQLFDDIMWLNQIFKHLIPMIWVRLNQPDNVMCDNQTAPQATAIATLILVSHGGGPGFLGRWDHIQQGTRLLTQPNVSKYVGWLSSMCHVHIEGVSLSIHRWAIFVVSSGYVCPTGWLNSPFICLWCPYPRFLLDNISRDM
jgi:hypothetical protein